MVKFIVFEGYFYKQSYPIAVCDSMKDAERFIEERGFTKCKEDHNKGTWEKEVDDVHTDFTGKVTTCKRSRYIIIKEVSHISY